MGVLRTFQHIFTQLSNASGSCLVRDVELCPPADLAFIRSITSKVAPVHEVCLHDLIVKQCAQRPSDLAIRSWEGDMTYGELEKLSRRLAIHLSHLGVGPETFVLSCFEKSTWAIVARLAILRAGGAYVSILASNPPAYLDSVVVRTKTTIMLTDSCFIDRFRRTVPTLVEVTPTWLRTLPTGDNLPICEDVRFSNACLVLFTYANSSVEGIEHFSKPSTNPYD